MHLFLGTCEDLSFSTKIRACKCANFSCFTVFVGGCVYNHSINTKQIKVVKLSTGPLRRLISHGWYSSVKGEKLRIQVWCLGWHQTTLFSVVLPEQGIDLWHQRLAGFSCSCSRWSWNPSQVLLMGAYALCFLFLGDAWLSRAWIWLLQVTCSCKWGMTKQILHPLVASCQPVRVNATSSDRFRKV